MAEETGGLELGLRRILVGGQWHELASSMAGAHLVSGSLGFRSSEPDGTVNIQPRVRPLQLPRTRRGMNRPGAISCQAETSSPSAGSAASGPGMLFSIMFCSARAKGPRLNNRFDFDFPALGRGHAGAVGDLSH